MIPFLRFSFLSLAIVLMAGCKSAPKKEEATASTPAAPPMPKPVLVDRAHPYQLPEGFAFKLDLPGEWYQLPSKDGQITAGQKPMPNVVPKIVMVRAGAADANEMKTPGGALAVFKGALERDPLNGRLSRVVTKVKEGKHKSLDCLFFSQEGQDTSVPGGLSIRDEGMVCTHPQRVDRFIYMGISTRWRSSQPVVVDVSAEKQRLFDSLTVYK